MRLKNLQLTLLAAITLCLGHIGSAFSLIGPYEDWQTTEINYRQPGDIGGFMSIGDEYRWNTPIVTYGFDASFYDYFGTNGVTAIEEAIAILNSLPPASEINLDEYPLQSQEFNFQAQALQLYDLKSVALFQLLEEMGLAEPDRGVWRIRERTTPPNTTNYWVIQRNYDPYTWEPTSVINGTIYTYSDIFDVQPPGPGALPVVEPLDPTAPSLSGAVASPSVFFGNPGGYFTGLTRDDVGGLRYLLRSNNFNVERLLPDVRVIQTNSQLEPLLTTDLTTFSEQARTNDPAALLSLYPDLLILSSNRFFTNVVTSNYFAVLTNAPWDPAIIFTIDYQWFFTTNLVTNYTYTFGNVVTNFGGPLIDAPIEVLIEETIAAPNPFDPAGSPFVTNVTSTVVLSNMPVGTIYILPTNVIGYDIVSTNFIVVAPNTNTIVFTNIVGGIPQSNTISYIRFETNYYLSVFPIELIAPTNSVALRPGVEKINFVRANYDSVMGPTFLTNALLEYVDRTIVSNQVIEQIVRRTTTGPDILFTVDDITPPSIMSRTDTSNWENNDEIHGDGLGDAENTDAGPGVITPRIVIRFSKNLPDYFNFRQGMNNQFLQQPNLGFLLNGGQSLTTAWATYDGTTNAPIIYPNGVSIKTFEDNILIP